MSQPSQSAQLRRLAAHSEAHFHSSPNIDRDSTGAPYTGILSPDEHNYLMRYAIRSKFTHLLRTLMPPNTA